MKTVLLAGGYGTRISEESHLKPKPMIEISRQPILWHIMKSYSFYGFNEFVICAGYMQHVIKDYFANYYLHCSDVTFDFLGNSDMIIHNNIAEPWKVTIIDTGLDTMTGGRIKRIAEYIDNESFMLTYGDGVCNVNLSDLLKFHRDHGKLATITAVRPRGRFGGMEIAGNGVVSKFDEKPSNEGGWINGGFMVLEPGVMDYIEDDDTVFEKTPLEDLAKDGQLVAYIHDGFWQCMDTLRDKIYLDELVQKTEAPWIVW